MRVKDERIMEIFDTIFESIKYAMKDIIILPGENLRSVFKYTVIITVINVLLRIFNLPEIKDYRGSILATILLGLVLLFGRRRKTITITEEECTDKYEEPIEICHDEPVEEKKSVVDELYDLFEE
jgi:hypothetical protein